MISHIPTYLLQCLPRYLLSRADKPAHPEFASNHHRAKRLREIARCAAAERTTGCMRKAVAGGVCCAPSSSPCPESIRHQLTAESSSAELPARRRLDDHPGAVTWTGYVLYCTLASRTRVREGNANRQAAQPATRARKKRERKETAQPRNLAPSQKSPLARRVVMCPRHRPIHRPRHVDRQTDGRTTPTPAESLVPRERRRRDGPPLVPRTARHDTQR